MGRGQVVDPCAIVDLGRGRTYLSPMLDRIKAFFADDARTARPGRHGFDDLQFASAALMAEAAMLDGALGARERERMTALLGARFDLTPSDAAALVNEAEIGRAQV